MGNFEWGSRGSGQTPLADSCGHDYRSSSSINDRGMSSVAEKLIVLPDGLCSVELVDSWNKPALEWGFTMTAYVC